MFTRSFLASCIAAALFVQVSASAQNGIVYTEASDLTLVGKLMDTPNPYHRVDTVAFKGFTKGENSQVRQSSGISVAFRTDSPDLYILTQFGEVSRDPTNTGPISARGYDLYIRENGQWRYAASKCRSVATLDQPLALITSMEPVMKDCLLYFPLYSEEYSIKLGIREGCRIEALPNPFRHRIGIFGSSYTHGSCTSRPGMSYPAQFTRKTGLQMLSLGCSGNSKLQDYFADVLAAADVDAYVFDSFSNPSPQMIRERLFPFIEKIQAAHPGKPLIFQQTIYREGRAFSISVEKSEAAKIAVADSMMRIACKKYKDVYFIKPDAVPDDHSASIDGIHPSNYGYQLWTESIVKPVTRILRKYGIK